MNIYITVKWVFFVTIHGELSYSIDFPLLKTITIVVDHVPLPTSLKVRINAENE